MTVLERVPVDRITVAAREVHVARSLLAVLLGVLYGLGWVTRKCALGLAVAGMSVKLGWQDAGRPAGATRGTS
jgi:hypothetical protein